MTQIIIRNALKLAAQNPKKPSNWRFFDRLGKRYKLFKHEEIIFSAISEARNQLFSPEPATVQMLEQAIERCVSSHRQDRSREADQRYCEDLRLKRELEPHARKMACAIGNSSRNYQINFQKIGSFLAEIQTRKNLQPLCDALIEVETSNAFIRTKTQNIALIDTKIDTFYAWKETAEYRHFITTYGQMRRQQIKTLNQTKTPRLMFHV